MPSPLAMQQIGVSPGKRSAMMMECGAADLLSPTKRGRNATEWARVGGLGAGMENLAPSLWAASAPGGWAPGAWQVPASCGMQHAQIMMQQHPAAQGGDAMMDSDAGAHQGPAGGGDGMEMDGGEVSRYERFPPSSACSPTHWHKVNSVGVPHMQTAHRGDDRSADESSIRSWECGYGGKSDFY